MNGERITIVQCSCTPPSTFGKKSAEACSGKEIAGLLKKIRMKMMNTSGKIISMKGDVVMSRHEKEGNKKLPTPRQKVIHNPAYCASAHALIYTYPSLHHCFPGPT